MLEMALLRTFWKSRSRRSLAMRYLLIVALSLLFIGPSSAAQPKSRRKSANPVNKQAQIGAYGRAAYPRYYWGIPAREYQNAGLPHGDIGILGSGIQREPW
jgi:hypothetical protein